MSKAKCDCCGRKSPRFEMIKDGYKEIIAVQDGETYTVDKLKCFQCLMMKGVKHAKTTIRYE